MKEERGFAAQTPCALCGGQKVFSLSERDRHGQVLRTVICQVCGLVWNDPVSNDETVQKFYTSDYRVQYKGGYQPKKKHCYRETLRAIERSQWVLPFCCSTMRVLDVGAGAGFFLYVLHREGVTADGVEPNIGYSEFGKQVLGLKTLRTGTLMDTQRDSWYDLITINHVFEHLPNPVEALRHMHKLLKPAGKILMEIPNIEATYHSPGNLFHIGHIYWYNPETIAAIAAKSGFSVERSLIQPGTKHMRLVLVKQVEEVSFHESNTEHILRIHRTHTKSGHFLSGHPYRNLIKKMNNYIREFLYVRRFKNRLDIVNTVCDEHLAK